MLARPSSARPRAALGKRVVQTQSYGPEARGGASKAEVIVAEEPSTTRRCASRTSPSCSRRTPSTKYAGDIRPGGLLIYDSGLVEVDPQDQKVVRCGLPFTQVATDELGKKVVTNIVAVGALAQLSAVLPNDAVRDAVLSRVPPRFKELNAQAFDLGLRLGEEAQAMLATPSAETA